LDDLVTIIIPVYNMSQCIRRCVDSVTAQTYDALQTILVDDGSTDESGAICDALAEQDPRIEVIHRENGGISAARNTGLDCVRGSWVSFIDSDDFVSPHYIENMLRAAVQNDCEISVCRFVDVEAEDEAVFHSMKKVERITGREAGIRHLSKAARILNTSWGKLYKSHLWDDIRFPDGRINEDVFVSHALYYHAEHVAVSDAVLYAYVNVEGSIMRSGFTARRLDVLDSWLEGVRFYSGVHDLDLERIARRVYCCRVYDARCIVRRMLRNERGLYAQLAQRAAGAYREARSIRSYADCSPLRTLAYRIKLFTGRRCLPLYSLLFVRGRTYI